MKKLLLLALAAIVLIGGGLFLAVRMLLGPESVRSAVEAQARAALGMPVTVGAASVQIWPRAALTLDQVVVGEPAQMTLRRAQVTTSLRGLLSRRIEDAELSIEQSRLDLPKLLATLDALAGPAPAAGSAPSSLPGVTIVNIRAIALRDVTLVAGAREANVTLESSLSGDRLDITRLSARSDASTVAATGAIESLAQRRARLTIQAEQLDLDGLLEFASVLSEAASASASPSAPPGAVPPGAAGAPPPATGATTTTGALLDLQADVKAAKGHLAGVTFTGLETKVAVTPQQVTLAPLSFATFGGRLTGDLAVQFQGRHPELTLAGAFEGLDLQQVSAFAGQPSAVTGTLNGRMRVRAQGLDPSAILSAATGTANVALSDGRMPGLQLVRPIILAFGRPKESAPADASGGERFDRIAATLAIDRGQIRTSDLRFASRDVDMDGAGTLGVAPGQHGALDLKVNLQLSEELSAQAGRDLVRYAREGNRVLLPATITGTVAAPVVMIDQQQALKRAIRNEVEERAKSLFERLLPGRKPK